MTTATATATATALALNERERTIAALAAAAGLPEPQFSRTRRRGVTVTLAGVTWYEDRDATRVADATGRGLLIVVPRAMRGGWQYSPVVTLISVDEGVPFARQVPGTVRTVAEAFAAITPAAGRKPGVVRQGDWFFTPAPRFQPREGDTLRENAALGGTRHVAAEVVERRVWRYTAAERMVVIRSVEAGFDDLTAAEMQRGYRVVPGDGNSQPDRVVRCVTRTVTRSLMEYYVRGLVTAPDHASATLDCWHRATPAPRTTVSVGRD